MARTTPRWTVLWLTLALVTSWGAAVSPGAALPAPEAPADDRAASPAAAAPWWTSWSLDADGDRIDDDLWRLLHDKATPAAARQPLPWAVTLANDMPRADVFVRFRSTPDAGDTARVQAITGGAVRSSALAEAVHATQVSAPMLAALAALPGVVGVEAERIVVPAVDTAIPASRLTFSDEYGNGARARWQVSGRGVVVAVLDSGVDQEHEAFPDDRYLGGYDATVPTGSLVGDTLLQEGDPDDDDPGGHGTHVAGTALGVTRDGTFIGVAPEARFLDVKVLARRELGGGGPQSEIRPSDVAAELQPLDDIVDPVDTMGLGSRIIEGLEFVERYNRGRSHLGPAGDDRVDVVTLSVQELVPDPEGDTVLAHAVNRLVDTGVVVVAAAGNCGPSGTGPCRERGNATISAPGSAKQAITVAALDDLDTIVHDDDLVAPFSSRGPNGGEAKPNLAAYGVGIRGPQNAPERGDNATNKYHELSGTSMAVPLVAGTVALMLELNRSLEPIDVKRILMDGARDVHDAGWDPLTGAGALDAMLALALASGRVTRDDIAAAGHDHGDHVHEEEQAEPEPAPPRLANRPPRVDFRYGPEVGQAGSAVVFVENVSDIDGDKIVRWVWDFGDGETGSGRRVAHVYTTPGDYVVRLSATDVNGTAGHGRREVTVVAGPEVQESPGAMWEMWVGGLLVGLVLAVRTRPGATPCHRAAVDR